MIAYATREEKKRKKQVKGEKLQVLVNPTEL